MTDCIRAVSWISAILPSTGTIEGKTWGKAWDLIRQKWWYLIISWDISDIMGYNVGYHLDGIWDIFMLTPCNLLQSYFEWYIYCYRWFTYWFTQKTWRETLESGISSFQRLHTSGSGGWEITSFLFENTYFSVDHPIFFKTSLEWLETTNQLKIQPINLVSSTYITGWWFGTFWLFFPYIGNVIIPTDELIFFIGVAQPPTGSLIQRKSLEHWNNRGFKIFIRAKTWRNSCEVVRIGAFFAVSSHHFYDRSHVKAALVGVVKHVWIVMEMTWSPMTIIFFWGGSTTNPTLLCWSNPHVYKGKLLDPFW